MKQWWFYNSNPRSDDYWESFISAKDPRALSDAEDFMGLKDKPECLMHVVEYAEYERLKGELELLKAYRSATGKITDEMFNEMVERGERLEKKLETVQDAVNKIFKLGLNRNNMTSKDCIENLSEIQKVCTKLVMNVFKTDIP